MSKLTKLRQLRRHLREVWSFNFTTFAPLFCISIFRNNIKGYAAIDLRFKVSNVPLHLCIRIPNNITIVKSKDNCVYIGGHHWSCDLFALIGSVAYDVSTEVGVRYEDNVLEWTFYASALRKWCIQKNHSPNSVWRTNRTNPIPGSSFFQMLNCFYRRSLMTLADSPMVWRNKLDNSAYVWSAINPGILCKCSLTEEFFMRLWTF